MAKVEIKNSNRFANRWLWTVKRRTNARLSRDHLEAAATRYLVDVEAILALDTKLSDEDFKFLRSCYGKSRANSEDMMLFLEHGPEGGSLPRDKGFQLWCLRVANSEVEIKAGGRAAVRQPNSHHAVELQWFYKGKTHVVTSLHILADDQIVLGELGSLDEYLVAFLFRVHRGDVPQPRPPRSRPAPGVARDAKFYRSLIELHESLLNEGHPAPVKEIASRMGENRGTVKSWLSRGRKYLGEETK